MRTFPAIALAAFAAAATGTNAFAGAALGSGAVLSAVRPTLPQGLTPPRSLAEKQPLVYVPAYAAGVEVYTQSGKLVQTFAQSTGATGIAMDDAGDVFVPYTQGSVAQIARYAIGGNTPVATYTPSKGPAIAIVQVSHQGELMDFHFAVKGSVETPVWDVWDAGSPGGKPSRTFHYAHGGFAFAVDNAGALYIPYFNAKNSTYDYDEIPAGSSKPSRTIVESLVPESQVDGFAPFTMVAMSDGALYVAEWSFIAGDPLAGLYVYPAHGKERYISKGASNPTGAAIDASGKVYVLNSNDEYQPSNGTITCDTLHTLSVYTPGATALLSQATSGFTNGQDLTVEGNGTAFISEFPYSPSQSCSDPQGVGAVALVKPGASVGTTLVPNVGNQDVSLYDGSVATNVDSQAEK